MLSKKEIDQWKTAGFIVKKQLLNVTDCIHDLKIIYPENDTEPILDFGSGGKTEFPCKFESLNKITFDIKLISCVKQLLETNDILLAQSVAWAKYGVPPKNVQSNCEQRIHMDYGNNMWSHPPKWNNPNAVAAIIYYSNTEKTGGATALVERKGDNDEVYSYPYIHMPGIAGKPFYNSKDAAELSVKGKTKHIRNQCYTREKKPNFNIGDVLFYRLDLWHRGTPVHNGMVRYVHNLLWKKKEATDINIWNQGWTRNMYYGWLEDFISTLNQEQRDTLGFPRLSDMPTYLRNAIYARYPKLSKL
tara:strand:- start:137 stop:1045 length:909 start_codon:yes stop_codon:yes gene_type:complete